MTNAGSSDATGVVVTDNFPASFTGVTFTATQSGGALGFTGSGNGNINDTVTMPKGSKVTYKAKGTISSSAIGILSDTATVTPPSGMTDSPMTNNSSTDNDSLDAQADLKIRLTDDRATTTLGVDDTYTIVVFNAGPSDVTGAVLRDSFPSAFTGASFTATQSGGASAFTGSGNGDINDTVTMPAGSTIYYKAKGTISLSATGTLSDTATVTVRSGATDSDLSNNSATDNDTFNVQADLKIRLTDDKTTATLGAIDTYTIVVTNLGPSNITGAVLKDSFPSAFTGASFTATQSGGALGFTGSGNGNINDTVTMPVGSTIYYKAKGTISSSATGTLSNTATVTAPSGATDSDLSNNSATDNDAL